MPFTVHPVTPPQFMEPSAAVTNPLLFVAGGNYYYVTGAEVGTTQATFNLWILKSTDGGTTWTQPVNFPLPAGYTEFAAAVLAGNKIWITFTPNARPFLLVSLDTVTNTFTTTWPGGPTATGIAILAAL